MAPSTDGEEDSTMASSLPEEILNIAILITAFGYKMMNSLGMLATIWATVVLLGGFSTLIKEDFWYVTVIAFVQSFGYAHFYDFLSLSYLLFSRREQCFVLAFLIN
jgi:hypothetical protein